MQNENTIADFILCECRERGEVLTHLKLQKLLYYAQAWSLADYDKPLFEEDFQAWIHGPVLPSQYQRFKHNEWRPIMDRDLVKPELEKSIEQHILDVIDEFGSETAIALEIMTHNEAPWINARNGIPKTQTCENIISKNDMKVYYKNLQEQYEKEPKS